MVTRFINIETALEEMQKLHDSIGGKDADEKELFNDTLEIIDNLLTVYQGMELPKEDFNREALRFAHAYFDYCQSISVA